jgi:hypothetical protein
MPLPPRRITASRGEYGHPNSKAILCLVLRLRPLHQSLGPLSINDTNGLQNKRPHNPTSPTSEVIHDVSPKIQLMNGYYMPHPSLPLLSPLQNEPTTNDQSTNGNDDNMFIFQNMYYPQSATRLAHRNKYQQQSHWASSLPSLPPASARLSHIIPTHRSNVGQTTTPFQKFPTGFHAMDLLIAHTAVFRWDDSTPSVRTVFGSRYVKSTVCRHRAVWRKANDSIKEQFEALGSDERACWGEFVRRVEGRPPGKSGGLGGVGNG